jgi:ABC-2 type transport system permease protein
VSAFRSIAAFELRHDLRSWLFWGTAAVFAFLSFRYMVTGPGDAQLGAVNRNAPVPILGGLTFFSMVGVFVSTAFVAGAALRDRGLGVQEIFFATPISRGAYIGGRFLGSFLAAVLILVLAAGAMMAGTVGPWADPDRLGPFMLAPYLAGFAFFVIPNLFVMCALFFALAIATRSVLWTYVGLVGLFLAYTVAGALGSPQLAALLDPFANRTFGYETRFWTTAELNTRVPGAQGLILWNRLIWVGLATAVLAASWARFPMGAGGGPRARTARRWWLPRRRGSTGPSAPESPAWGSAADVARPGLSLPPVTPAHGGLAELSRLRSQARLEVRQTMRSLPFLVILALAVLAVAAISPAVATQWGSETLPVTRVMVDRIHGGFYVFLFLLVTVFAGEMVWRDRQARMADVVDATPAGDLVFWGAKLAALLAILLVVLTVGILTGMGIQLAQGYTSLEPGLYLSGVFLELGIPFLQVGVLALFLQALVNHKYAGFGLMLLFFLSAPALNALGLDHPLYRFASAPPLEYSAMNGYGHFAAPLAWFSIYWTFAALTLMVLVRLLWVRGRETGYRARLRRLRSRLTPPTLGVTHFSLAGFLLTGGWIFYNTNVLNRYESPADAHDRQARYEREYGRFAGAPQPRIARVHAQVDIYPERRDLVIRGRYDVENRSGAPVDSIHLVLPPGMEVREVALPGDLLLDDAELGYRIYGLRQPLSPGESMTVSFELALASRGFVAGRSDTRVVANGTYFDHRDYFPHIGYDAERELLDPVERRRRGLPPWAMPALGDESSRSRHVMSAQADWIEVESVVSTSPGQRAVATGSLVREWTVGDRSHFHYRTETPVPGFWAYFSGDWAVARHRWNDQVDIEIYHHPGHAYNVDVMAGAVKRSLDYLTRHLGPYPLRELRIVQVHRPAGLAFPGKIVVSEDAGITARLDRPRELAGAYLGIAHEVSHQWWAYQAIGANQQGSMMVMETLAQYAGLMVAEEVFGPLQTRELLRRDLERYLQARGMARSDEVPLLLVEDHRHIRYAKGALVMYWLRELLGENQLNRALAGYLERVSFQDPPYTTAKELLDAIREVTPPEHQPLLVDLFETITLWDLRATWATAAPRDDGRWDVRLEVSAAKVRSDGQGNETPTDMDDVVEIGVFGAPADGAPPEGRVLHLERVRLTGGTHVLELVVDHEPRRAGIDPFNRLIDRNPGDNVVRVNPARPHDRRRAHAGSSTTDR